jgi:hypothetical protein
MRPRLVQLVTGAVVALAALSACRREVPTVPVPVPDQTPKPKTQVVAWAPR